MTDFLRTAHSGQAAAGSELVVESTVHDELPAARPADPAATLAVSRVRGQVRSTDAARALASLPRASAFVPRQIRCDPRFKAHNKRRIAWIKKRRAELHDASGGVSSGVGAYIVSAGWLFAAGEFAAELAAETGDLEGFKAAAQLTQTARQHDLAAWSLAQREAAARPVDPAHHHRQIAAQFAAAQVELDRQRGST